MEPTIEFFCNSRKFRLLAKPFWTSHAFRMYDGSVGVARVDAVDAAREDDHYMLDLTQTDLDRIRANPDYAALPDPHFCPSVETRRPTANDPARKVASKDEQQRVYDALQNEGYDEPEFVDNTPYQKGDDQP